MSKKVLIVDDDAGICKAVGRAFRLAGWEPKYASSAENAGLAMAWERPDVVVTDWCMPKVGDGELVVKACAELDLPVVVQSSHETAEAFCAVSGVPYVRKPYDVADLITAADLAVRGILITA